MTKKIKLIEEYDIKEGLKNERRDWISKVTEETKEPPYSVEWFYKKKDAERPANLDDAQLKEKGRQEKDKLKKLQDDKKKNEAGAIVKCINVVI